MCHTEGTIYNTDKAQLIKLIEKKCNYINQQPLRFDIGIIDGYFLLHLMKEIPQTFDDISKKFFNMILQFKSIGPNQILPHNFVAELKYII